MANLLLPILAGNLGQGECPTTLQGILNLFANNMQAVLANGRSFYNYGPDKPAPEFQPYPWLRTTDGRWYQFSGVWRSPYNYDPSERRLWIGAEADLVNYDGGSAGAVTPTTGPAWVVDHSFDGRSPMGPGLIANDPTTKSLNVAENYGSGAHTLTEAEGGTGSHTHPYGLYVAGTGAGFAGQLAPVTVAGFQTLFIGENSPAGASATTANMFTLPANNGNGVTMAAFSITHPVRGLFVIQPSGRTYRTVI